MVLVEDGNSKNECAHEMFNLLKAFYLHQQKGQIRVFHACATHFPVLPSSIDSLHGRTKIARLQKPLRLSLSVPQGFRQCQDLYGGWWLRTRCAHG